MNRSFVLSLVLASLVAVAPVGIAGSREQNRLEHGKITKNEAQHLVLKKYPGATVKQCVLKKGQDHSVWVLDVVRAGMTKGVVVQVDGLSGAITP